MTSDLDLRFGPPQAEELSIISGIASNLWMSLGIFSKLIFPFTGLCFGDDISQHDTASVMDQVHQSRWEACSVSLAKFLEVCFTFFHIIELNIRDHSRSGFSYQISLLL